LTELVVSVASKNMNWHL